MILPPENGSSRIKMMPNGGETGTPHHQLKEVNIVEATSPEQWSGINSRTGNSAYLKGGSISFEDERRYRATRL
jgi:hypothetical protein